MEKKIISCVDSIMKLEALEKSLTEAKDHDAERELALREAQISGENIAPSDISRLENQSRNSEKNLMACRSLLIKKNLELIELEKAYREDLSVSEVSLVPEINKFREDCSKKLVEVIVESQILLNFVKGERYGNELLTAARDYLFFNQEKPESGPDPYNTLIEKLTELTQQRFNKTPLAKLEAIRGTKSSRSGESVEAVVERLLVAARNKVNNSNK